MIANLQHVLWARMAGWQKILRPHRRNHQPKKTISPTIQLRIALKIISRLLALAVRSYSQYLPICINIWSSMRFEFRKSTAIIMTQSIARKQAKTRLPGFIFTDRCELCCCFHFHSYRVAVFLFFIYFCNIAA